MVSARQRPRSGSGRVGIGAVKNASSSVATQARVEIAGSERRVRQHLADHATPPKHVWAADRALEKRTAVAAQASGITINRTESRPMGMMPGILGVHPAR